LTTFGKKREKKDAKRGARGWQITGLRSAEWERNGITGKERGSEGSWAQMTPAASKQKTKAMNRFKWGTPRAKKEERKKTAGHIPYEGTRGYPKGGKKKKYRKSTEMNGDPTFKGSESHGDVAAQPWGEGRNKSKGGKA